VEKVPVKSLNCFSLRLRVCAALREKSKPIIPSYDPSPPSCALLRPA
jgi:hypothetical protein